MKFELEIDNVQTIERFSFELDLSKNEITCIVGRNGIGKTTLVRALNNLSHSDTFLRTGPTGIFSRDSAIRYWVDGERVSFYYDDNLESLNCKDIIPQNIRALCAVELSIPHGSRFNFFQTVSRADRYIRRQLVLEEYNRPEELIEFLSAIYSSEKFQSLVEVEINGHSYYCILLDDGKYIREDYLSSGEYFLIHLYRTLRSSARLIVVDEIDISLDAAAQVQLLRRLRDLCAQYECNVLFTTHSLAMMRTLQDHELFYMEKCGVKTILANVSYSYVRSLLFGFKGWDRYILTEDIVLGEFLETLISYCNSDVFFQYKIIHIGGGSQVVDLLVRNRGGEFLADAESVIAILDGDQSREPHASEDRVHCLPFESVEKALLTYYCNGKLPCEFPRKRLFENPKDLFNSLHSERVMAKGRIYEYIYQKNKRALKPLLLVLKEFLLGE